MLIGGFNHSAKTHFFHHQPLQVLNWDTPQFIFHRFPRIISHVVAGMGHFKQEHVAIEARTRGYP